MKKEWIENDHCPYCKRHCSLQNPHCRKGKTLAEELKKEERKASPANTEEAATTDIKVQAFTDTEKTELKQIQSDLKLFLLYQMGSDFLSKKAEGKNREKKARQYIRTILAEKGEVTPKELKVLSDLQTEELKKALIKMENKGEICIQPLNESGRRISLTEKGAKSARRQTEEGKKEKESLFSMLSEEEKDRLEEILRKMMK